jgi:hypothetical protein
VVVVQEVLEFVCPLVGVIDQTIDLGGDEFEKKPDAVTAEKLTAVGLSDNRGEVRHRDPTRPVGWSLCDRDEMVKVDYDPDANGADFIHNGVVHRVCELAKEIRVMRFEAREHFVREASYQAESIVRNGVEVSR